MATLEPSSRLLAQPIRERENGFSPVEKSRIMKVVVPDLVNTVTTTKLVRLNGLLCSMYTSAPAIPTDTTFTVALINEDGITEYTSGNIADDSKVYTNIVASNIYLCGNYTIKITFTTVLSGNTTTFDVQFLNATT